MYISFKAWFDTCNKMSLSVKWYRCLDLAIYTDLFTLIWSLKICISLYTLLIYLSTNQWRWNSNHAWIWILIFHGYCFFKSFIMLYCVCVKRNCNCLCFSSSCDSASLTRNIGKFRAKNCFTDHRRTNIIHGFRDSVPVLKIHSCY